MTTSLITLYPQVISGETADTVNARELHTFLEVGRKFATRIVNRIKQYGFEEQRDYILISPNGETNGKGGDRRSLDYYLTLDMAKELAMVERNEKGRQARRYFIECEKKLKEQVQIPSSLTDEQALEAKLLDRVQVLVFEKGQLVSTHPLNKDDLITSGKPEQLSEFVQLCVPGYALVKKKSVLKAQQLLAGLG
ncbi:antA/AntB antirepressor family protein [Zooshikella marina]|uniref:antA/AntB antirepressor family protein n=1 Tax=Zooshikella ganghwensis TaxID=202772 RepID=UPI001BAF46FA|nr:antA/AntB antirepressor family protein [Zooshikella ganghwensis]MBU2709376.1 antA/AntB antirepressor family protein [Zooshikella ganghwensis]